MNSVRAMWWMVSALAGAVMVGLAQAGDPILLNSGELSASSNQAQALRVPAGQFDGRALRLVQFPGAIQPEWFAELKASGVQIVDYIANNAYLVYGDAAALAKVSANRSQSWDGAYPAALKRSAQIDHLAAKQIRPDGYSIQLVADDDSNAKTLALISERAAKPIHQYRMRHYVNISADVPIDALEAIAARPDVLSIQPDFTPTLNDERQGQILANALTGGSPNLPVAGSYLDFLAARGFTQAQFARSDFTVDVSDSGLDDGTITPQHFSLYRGGLPGTPFDPSASRVVYNKLEGTAAAQDLTGCGGVGHGNWVSHVIAGNTASQTRDFPHGDGSFYYGMGIAPFVRLGNSAFFTNGGTFTNPVFPNAVSRAYSNLGTNVSGARISNNSWGAAVSGAYSTSSQAYDALVRDAQPAGSTHPADGNQQMAIVFAAGNSGPGAGSMGAPGSAKNVFTAGGSQNVRPGVADAADADAMYSSSSRGPTADQRVKPDIIAPATNVAGGVVMADRSPAAPGNAAACYTGTFLVTSPVQQRFYRTGNGTSFSSPAVAGASALVRQHFINSGGAFNNTPPSPAMNKAYLMNAATYLASLTDNLPSNNQGMGRMNLARAFDTTPRQLRDQVAADNFSASGQRRSFSGTVAGNTAPFRVTLAYTDAPGPTTGAAFVNNLDLRVTVGGVTYLGNSFNRGNSIAGGSPDVRNNVESVFIPAGVSGNFNVTVAATNVAAPADPIITTPNQDFALVVYNAASLQQCLSDIVVGPATIPGTAQGGVAYPSQTLTATGGSGAIAYSASGQLPPGLSITGNTLSGTPTTPGSYTFSVTAQDASGCVGTSQSYTINVVSASLGLGLRAVSTGNSVIEPNECNSFNVTLNNTGTFAATGITATLSTTTPGMTITQATSTYPDLPATTGQAINTTPFQISSANSLQCFTTANLMLTVTYSGGASPTMLPMSVAVGEVGGAYVFESSTGAAIPDGGVGPIAGSSVDDAVVNVTLPADFSTQIYSTTIAAGSVIRVSTNGNIQFVATGGSTGFTNTALPASAFGATTPVLLGFWDDLVLSSTGGGIYTQTVGTAPNRQFIVEWRGRRIGETAATQTTRLAIVLNEGSNAFEYRYVEVASAAPNQTGASATVGVQSANSGTLFTQHSFNQPVITPGLVLRGRLPSGVCVAGTGECRGDLIFANGFGP